MVRSRTFIGLESALVGDRLSFLYFLRSFENAIEPADVSYLVEIPDKDRASTLQDVEIGNLATRDIIFNVWKSASTGLQNEAGPEIDR
jgi:hypothetical protein